MTTDFIREQRAKGITLFGRYQLRWMPFDVFRGSKSIEFDWTDWHLGHHVWPDTKRWPKEYDAYCLGPLVLRVWVKASL